MKLVARRRVGKSLFIGIAAVLLCLVGGCNKKAPESQPLKAKTAKNKIALDASLELVSATEEKERDDFQAQVLALDLKGDFQQLETMAEEFRSKKSKFPGSHAWKLRYFYLAFDALPGDAPDAAWLKLLGQLKLWAERFPKSITPRLALVVCYHHFAWRARGGMWADQVPEKSWRLMEDRLSQAYKWLESARQTGQACPAFHAMALRSFMLGDFDRQAYEKVFQEGVKKSPDFTALYEYKAYYLLPRWYGKAGEWEAYAREICTQKNIPQREELFARIAMYLRNVGLFYDEFSNDDRSWSDLKASFRALEKNYPDSLEIKSVFCLICVKLYDYREAREQMKLLNSKVDLSVWEDKDNFLEAVRWLAQDDSTLEGQRRKFKVQPR